MKQLFPTGRFFSFFSFMSIVGVMLGVCVLIIVQSVMNGFGEGIRSRLVSTHGDIRIRSNEVLEDWKEVIERLRSEPEVRAAAPFAEGVVMLEHERRPQFPMVRGIDPGAEEDVVSLEDFLTVGTTDDLHDKSVFLGEGLARSLKAGPGASVEVFSPLMLERLEKDEVLLPKEFEVAGLFRTGSPDVDGNTMIMTLRAMQETYGLGDGVHGIALKLQPEIDAEAYARGLDEGWLDPSLNPVSWREAHQDFLFVVEMEKRVISFIIIFIILVASFSIAIALMMAVIRKTREIGLLVAMGARPRQVAYGFCCQGFVIGVVGALTGIGLALLCLRYRQPILAAYTTLTGTTVNFLGVYDVYELPVHYLMSDFIMVSAFAILISTLAGLLPAIRAARLKPADALRSE
ncbi:MAG: ABC transporter permease [Opitutales bacterium]